MAQVIPALFAKGAATAATTSLGTGIATGMTIGKGVAALTPTASGIFSAAQPALAGLPSALASKGLAAAPGIFANPAAAGFLGKSFTTPGLLNTMGMSPLGGLAGSTGMVPTATGLSSLYSTVPAITSSPAVGGAFNIPGLTSPLGGAQAIIPNATVAGQSAALQTLKGNVIGAGAQAQTNLAQQLAMDAAKKQAVGSGTQSLINTAGANANIANTNASVIDAINRNVAGGAAQTSPGITAGPAPYTPASPIIKGQNFLQNAGNFFKDPSVDAAIDYAKEHPMATAGLGLGAYQLLKPKDKKPPAKDVSLIRPYDFDYNPNAEAYATSPTMDSSERLYFEPTFTARTPYEAPGPEYRRAASGGIMSLAVGGPVETMSAMNAVGANTGYPMANIDTAMYSNPMMQRPEAANIISPSGDAGVDAYSGEPKFAAGGTAGSGLASYAKDRTAMRTNQNTYSQNINSGSAEKFKATMRAAKSGDFAAYKALQDAGYDMQAASNYAAGGISHLGDYSDGGRLLKGPGDGVSDSIPASIGGRQPARLADGEFVIPARIVSEIGNGSTEAGARKLYAMMDRVQKARRKTVGKKKVAVNTRADKHLPA